MSIDVDALDFATILPPLKPDEYTSLRESIEAHGVLDPLIYWEETGELIDGFHRAAITEELGIVDYPRVAMSFPSKYHALIFVMNKHLGRRSLTLLMQTHTRDVVRELARYLVNDEGLTQQAAATQLGIGQATVSRYVNPVIQVNNPEEPQEMDDVQRTQRPMVVGDLDELPPFPREPDEVRAYRSLMIAARLVMTYSPDALLDAPREPVMRERDFDDAMRFLDWFTRLIAAWTSRRSQPQLRRVQ